MSETPSKKRKASLPLVIAGGVSSLVLALGMSPTFSAFTASITNDTNTAGTGRLVMTETSGAIPACVSTSGTNGLSGNAAVCSSINKYGGSTTMVPGTPVVTNVSIQNTGTVAASAFTLAFGTCAEAVNGTPSGSATDMCTKMLVKVESGSTLLTPIGATATTLNGTTLDIKSNLALAPIAGGSAAIPLVVTVTLPSVSSAVDNTYQGRLISQSMTWTFQS